MFQLHTTNACIFACDGVVWLVPFSWFASKHKHSIFNLCRVVVLVLNKLSSKGPYVKIITKFGSFCIHNFICYS